MGDLVVTKHRKAHSKPDDTCTDGEAEGTTLTNKQDVAQTSMVNGSSNEQGSHVQSNSAKLCGDGDTREVETDSASHNADSLHELLQLAKEYESVDASKRESDDGCHPQTEGSCSHEEIIEQSSGVKEDVECASNKKIVTGSSQSEGSRLKSTASEKGVSAAAASSQSKTPPIGDQRTLHKKEVGNMGQAHATGNKKNSRSASLSSITIGPSRSHFTIPQPFSLATDRRALGGGRPREEDGGQVSQGALGLNGAFEDSHSRSPQVSRRLCAKLPIAKSIRSESVKHSDESFKRSTTRANLEHPDEDTMSISSVRSCSHAPKAKASRFTSTSGFKFQSDARAEKRKEYYSKLQERLKAKEEEMKHMQAKAKVPTTRAKSPNFTRRDSHSGFRLCNAIRCEEELRSSLSPQDPGKGNKREVLDKEIQNKRAVAGRGLSESPKEQMAEGKTPSSASATAVKLLDVEISLTGGDFEDVHIKVRDPLTVSCELMMSDEEEKVHAVPTAESTHVASDGEGDQDYLDKISSSKEGFTVNGSLGRPKEINVLKGHGNANGGVMSFNSNKVKTDRKVQPLAFEEQGFD